MPGNGFNRLTDADKARAQALYRANALRPHHSMWARVDAYLQKRQRRAIIEAAEFAPGQRVMDLGAGLGELAHAAKQAGAYVTALDAVPEALAQVAPLVDRTIVADVETFTCAETFDRVLLIGVLDFMANPEAVLHKACALVKPGGRLVLLVPTRSLGGLFYLVEKRLKGIRVNLFTPDWCRAVAQNAGLGVLQSMRPLPSNIMFTFKRPLAS